MKSHTKTKECCCCYLPFNVFHLLDPSKVSTNQNWVAGSMSLVSLKAPTVVLFNENQEFHSFGYEAENAYSELALDGDHQKYYFFKRFKMRLHEKKVCSSKVCFTLTAVHVYNNYIFLKKYQFVYQI